MGFLIGIMLRALAGVAMLVEVPISASPRVVATVPVISKAIDALIHPRVRLFS